MEECHQQGKGQTGLDQHQVRTWHSFHRHTVLSMCAQALLAVAAARPAPDAGDRLAASAAAQPAAWRDTGKLPASPDDRPPGDDPGLVKVSVPEARRLLRLATAPMSRAARDLGYAWSRWPRRHQAHARWHHYHARLKNRRGHLIPVEVADSDRMSAAVRRWRRRLFLIWLLATWPRDARHLTKAFRQSEGL